MHIDRLQGFDSAIICSGLPVPIGVHKETDVPILLNVNQLKPGMCLAANLINKYTVLLPHGRRLNERDISALRRKFPHLSAKISDPLLDDFADFQDDSKDDQVSREVRRNVATVTDKVSQTVRSRVALTAEHVSGMETVVNNMVQYLQDNPVTVAMVDQAAGWDSYLQEHCGNVFYLSLLMGNAIRNYIKAERERLSAAKIVKDAMNLTPLGTAAMFHDLGMVPLEKLYSKAEPLTPDEIEAIRQHPLTGLEMLPEAIDPMVRLIIRSHHENQDGSGYPDGRAGDKINIFARIVRIADAYSAAIADKAYTKAKSPVVVLHEMLHGPFHRFYDPVALKVFASIVKPFPIGAKLQLESGECAIVVRHDKDPFNPHIMIAFDDLGDPLDKEALQPPFPLKDRDDVRLLSFGQEDISFLNDADTDPTEGEIDLTQSYENAFDLAYP